VASVYSILCLFFDYDAFCSDLTGVAIDRKVRVAEELNALDFEGIEQDIGEVVGRVVDTGKGNLVAVLVTLEVVEELEPELLVSTVLLLVVLVVGVFQSLDVVAVTALVSLAVRQTSAANDGTTAVTGEILPVDWRVELLGVGLAAAGRVGLLVGVATVSVEVGRVHASESGVIAIVGNIFQLLWTSDNVGEFDADLVDLVEVVGVTGTVLWVAVAALVEDANVESEVLAKIVVGEG